MKFLCVDCDEPMKLAQTVGPDEGSFTIVYSCPSCGKQTAMLTNAMETQMVRSLGVKIGGSTVAPEPMEMVRNSLSGSRASDEPSQPSHGHGPFAGGDASKCPFTGVIADAYAKQQEPIVWTKEAEERISRIPEFAQPMVRKGVEMHAIENGHHEITEALLDEVKTRFNM